MLVFMLLNELRQFVQNTMVLLIDFCLKVKEQIKYQYHEPLCFTGYAAPILLEWPRNIINQNGRYI